jgi:hypothetical protein
MEHPPICGFGYLLPGSGGPAQLVFGREADSLTKVAP